MSKAIQQIKELYHRTWLKLLKAEAKHNEKKVAKHEKALLELTLRLKESQ